MAGLICKGSIALGTGCGKCTRCKAEIAAGVKPYPKPDRAPMRAIPISSAERIAKTYGYDQVVIMARRVGLDGGEHITTYGVNKTHCAVAETMGTILKNIARWPSEADRVAIDKLYERLFCGTFGYADYDAAQEQINALGRLLGK